MLEAKICEKLLDMIFPPSGDALVVRSLTKETVSKLYQPQTIHGTYYLSSFRDTRIRALIHESKFHRNSCAQVLLSELVTNMLIEYGASPALLIPIPLSSQRKRSRGYNQVTSVLKRAELPLGITIRTDILSRNRDTPPQTEISREERLKNLRGAFSVRKPNDVTGAHILLFDDVLTTGATLNEAKHALLPFKPASLRSVAFAH